MDNIYIQDFISAIKSRKFSKVKSSLLTVGSMGNEKENVFLYPESGSGQHQKAQ